MIPEGWTITARMPALDIATDPSEAYYASQPEQGAGREQYGRIFWLRPGTGPEVPDFPRDYIPKAG